MKLITFVFMIIFSLSVSAQADYVVLLKNSKSYEELQENSLKARIAKSKPALEFFMRYLLSDVSGSKSIDKLNFDSIALAHIDSFVVDSLKDSKLSDNYSENVKHKYFNKLRELLNDNAYTSQAVVRFIRLNMETGDKNSREILQQFLSKSDENFKTVAGSAVGMCGHEFIADIRKKYAKDLNKIKYIDEQIKRFNIHNKQSNCYR